MRFGGWEYAVLILGVIAGALLATADPALAFARPPSGGPIPVLGVGLPAAGVVVTLLLAHRFRRDN